jgi:hypothetical protein
MATKSGDHMAGLWRVDNAITAIGYPSSAIVSAVQIRAT